MVLEVARAGRKFTPAPPVAAAVPFCVVPGLLAAAVVLGTAAIVRFTAAVVAADEVGVVMVAVGTVLLLVVTLLFAVRSCEAGV